MGSEAVLHSEARQLVEEFQGNLALDERDALRSAFIVFAYRRGYSKAKIGRFQGISRARVEQKVSKYLQYAQTGALWPVLGDAMPSTPPEPNGHREVSVSFKADDWKDLNWAIEMVNRVV